ncbi:Protein unc-50 [Kappamyces sp. JEL0680]|nr:Protein unc-50 [Kappamyces sp. JEL0680]
MNRHNTTTTLDLEDDATMARKRRNSSPFSVYLKRIAARQLDFELALWTMFYLLTAPSRVTRTVFHQKQTKNYYYRDDPAFYILFMAAMIVYSATFDESLSLVRSIFYTVFVDFIALGCLVATTTWYLTNTFMLLYQTHIVEEKVEWMYCLDVHSNAFFPFFMITYVLQFFLASIVLQDGFVGRLVANSLYVVAAIYYWYVTYLGFNAIPFVKHPIVFLYPAVGCSFLYIVSIFSFNISRLSFDWYFG